VASSPPLQQPYDSPYAVLCRCPCSFTFRVGARDEIISSPAEMRMLNQAVNDAATHRPVLALCRSRPLPANCSPPAPRGVSFSDSLFPTPSCQEQLGEHPGTVFSQPCRGGGGVVHAPGRLLLPSLHSSGTHSNSRDRQ
jgi:hypothetical protein